MKKLLVNLVATYLMLTAGVALATSGATPKGKPFVNLQAQIYEVREGMATLEEQLIVDQTAIVDLQAEIAILQAAVDSNTGNTAKFQEDLDAANLKLTYLEGEIFILKEELSFKQDLINGRCPMG